MEAMSLPEHSLSNMPEEAGVELPPQELKNAPEAKDLAIRDTVPLLPGNGEYVHIETTKAQLMAYFKEYANSLGFNGEQAGKYFEENVDFTFNPKIAHAKYNDPNLSAIDNAMSKAVQKLWPAKPVGQVLQQKNGRLSMYVDPGAIAAELPKSQGSEVRIAILRHKINTTTNHELYHVLQFMTKPEMTVRKSRQMATNQKIFVGVVLGATAGVIMPDTIPYTLGTISGMRCFSAIINGRDIDVEKDAYIAEKTDISKLQRRPFNFVVEKDPKPRAK